MIYENEFETLTGLNGLEIAVIGMSCKVPGANTISEFWENLKNGVESISFFSDEELEAAGVDSIEYKAPNYVKAGGILENGDCFDSFFFGFSATEASVMDPQIRIYLECCWHAMEDAGYVGDTYNGSIGVYASGSSSLGWEMRNLLSGKTEEIGLFSALQLMSKDFLSVYVSYKLNLKGPAAMIQTACSSSLMGIHTAIQAVLNGECDMALAGGVCLVSFEKKGYLYQEGLIYSPDGHCRAFDALGKGTVGSNGAGAVLLKRLEKAVEDHDHIYAIVKGTAANNDGNRKIGFTAPSIDGEAEAIVTAQQMGEIDPENISYVETHGTSTELGDPMEIEAMKLAFNTDKKGFCAIGSVKTNLGHTDAAAGVLGFIKTVLSLYHKMIPPSLHYKSPNPKIDFENSPFYVNNKLNEWKESEFPRTAGVSAFGIGGTNVHAILQESPIRREYGPLSPQPSSPANVLLLSAKSASALTRMTENLLDYLKTYPRTSLNDVAYTLQVGRKSFKHRKMLACSSVNEAIEILSGKNTATAMERQVKNEKQTVVFMFPGVGQQYVNMGKGLYDSFPVFREEIDTCSRILKGLLGYDFKDILYPQEKNGENASESKGNLGHVIHSQLAIFVFEYALAKLMMNWGIKPNVLIGYSLGEYTAACISGVFSLEDALKTLVVRVKLIDSLPTGTMLSVPLSQKDLTPLLTNEMGIAIDNGPSCIVAGPENVLDNFHSKMKERKIFCLEVSNTHAIHSKMMEPVIDAFERHLQTVEWEKATIPYISNLTGEWVKGTETANAEYWCRHLKETVRFGESMEILSKLTNPVFIEVGPGRDLSVLVSRYYEEEKLAPAINLVRPSGKNTPDDTYLFTKLGQLWLYGINPDWYEIYIDEKPYRLPLPLYSFDSYRFPAPPFPSISPGTANERFIYRNKAGSGETIHGMGMEQASPGNRNEVNEGTLLERPEMSTRYIAPGTDMEKILCELWSKFFGFREVGINDDFFDLGGDSLKAMTVASKIRSMLSLDIPVEEFYNRPTIEQLAAYIDTMERGEGNGVEPAEEKEYYVMSSSQKRLFMLQEIDKQTSAYNVPFILLLEGHLDPGKVETVFRKLIHRHEGFRTAFIVLEKTGEVVQRIIKPGEIEFKIEYHDITASETATGNEQVTSLLHSFVRGYDLSTPPLMRVGLIKMEEGKYILMVDTHHIISDGTSFAILQEEFMVFYEEKGDMLPLLLIQYKDYAEWQMKQNENAQSMLRKQEAYWLSEFKGNIPVLDLPLDFARPETQSFEGYVLHCMIPPSDVAGLKKLVAEQGTSMFIVLLSIFNILLSRLSGQEDIAVGTQIQGRRYSEFQRIFGVFINTLVLRNHPLHSLTFNEFVGKVKEKTLKAYDNQDLQFEDFTEKLLGKRDLKRNPLFDVMLIWLNMESKAVHIPGLKLSPYDEEIKTGALIDLTIYGSETGDSIKFDFEYNTTLFKKETIERYMEYFKQIVSIVIANPGIKLEDITISHDLGAAKTAVLIEEDDEFGF